MESSSLIGCGQFGKVHAEENKETGEMMAVKYVTPISDNGLRSNHAERGQRSF